MAKIEFCGVAKIKTKKTKQKLMTFFQEEKTCENDAEISNNFEIKQTKQNRKRYIKAKATVI